MEPAQRLEPWVGAAGFLPITPGSLKCLLRDSACDSGQHLEAATRSARQDRRS